MVKSVIVGVVWCAVLYFATCMIVGGVAGFIATASIEEGQDPATIGAHAGQDAVQSSRIFVALGAIVVAAAGTYFQKLPGTKSKTAS